MENFINIDIIKEPLNWLTVILMLVIGAYALALLMTWLNERE